MYIQDIVKVKSKVDAGNRTVGYLVENVGFVSVSAMNKVEDICDGLKEIYKIPVLKATDLGKDVYGVNTEVENLQGFEWLLESGNKERLLKGTTGVNVDDYTIICANRQRNNDEFIKKILTRVLEEMKSCGRYIFTLIEVNSKKTYVFGGKMVIDAFVTTKAYEMAKESFGDEPLKIEFWVMEIGNREMIEPQDRLPQKMLRALRIEQSLDSNLKDIKDAILLETYESEIV